MTLRIDRITSPDQLGDFIALPEHIYRGDPRYVATSPATVRSGVFRDEFEGRQEILLAQGPNGPRARCVARVSPTMVDETGTPLGMIGLFESFDDSEAAGALLRDALQWLAGRGVRTVIGPMDGDTWHKYRFNAGPWDDEPFLMEPYNPAYYQSLWESCGFREIEKYYSKVVDAPAAAAVETSRIAERALRRFRLRPFRRDAIADELGVIYSISKRIFAGNRFYTDISLPEFRSLYDGVGALLEEGLNWFAQDEAGNDVGFVFAFPDRFRAIQAMRGRKSLWAKLRFLQLRSSTDTVNIKTLGVVPEHQRTGVALALMNRVYVESVRQGYRRVNLCLIREGNASGRMDGGAGRLLRRYVLLGRSIP